MAVTSTILYGTSTAITFGVASLASDTNLLAGRQSNSVDNTSDLAIDTLVGGKFKLGSSPTTGKVIEVWCVGSYDGTTFAGNATGSDGNLTTTATDKVMWKLLTIIPTDATTGHVYNWGPYSIAQAFGGTMPKKWSIFIVHNTAVSLDSTAGNHEMKYTTVKYVST